MQTFTEFLKKNPNLLSKYVAVSTVAINALVYPLNKFMKHLLVVQDIDPNTQPGDRAFQALSDQLDKLMNGSPDQEEYTGPFSDEKWLQKCLQRAKGRFSKMDQDVFKQITDLNRWSDKKEDAPLQVTLSNGTIKEVMESAQPVYTTSDQEVFAKMAPSTDILTGNSIDSIREALKTLEQYATKLEPTEVVSPARCRTIVGSARRFPLHTSVVRSFKNGLFRRVETKKE